MIPRAKELINDLDNETLVLIPSLVIAEFLMNVPPNLHAMVINLFAKKSEMGLVGDAFTFSCSSDTDTCSGSGMGFPLYLGKTS